MSMIYTKRCVICKRQGIVVAGGHVVRKSTFIGGFSNHVDIHIIASLCDDHQNNKPGSGGYYGEYSADMGMTDDPFRENSA